jgi:hypothetical protein
MGSDNDIPNTVPEVKHTAKSNDDINNTTFLLKVCNPI